jgi:hypothetical protein
MADRSGAVSLLVGLLLCGSGGCVRTGTGSSGDARGDTRDRHDQDHRSDSVKPDVAKPDAARSDVPRTDRAPRADGPSPERLPELDRSSEPRPPDLPAPDTWPGLPPLTGSLVQLVQTMPFPASGSQGFALPAAGQIQTFKKALQELLAHQLKAAAADFSAIGLELLDFTDTTSATKLHLVRESPSQPPRGWGILAVNPAPARALVLEAPHGKADLYTETEAAEFFLALKATALLVAGAHRCANSQSSPCDGTTSICSAVGSDEPFRESDVAHHPGNLFHAAHEVLHGQLPGSVALQLHGFARGAAEPHAYVSDGTTALGGPSNPANKLAASLRTIAKDPNAAESCSEPGTPSSNCGTYNVQGRHSNGSASPCTVAAPTAGGRFLHLDQSLDLRSTSGPINRGQLLAAVQQVFP